MKIKEVIVVEGKMDTVRIQQIMNVDTIETNGSQISKATLKLIQKTAEKRGIIVFTDPDYPGQKIRQTIMAYVPSCKHAFIDKNKAIKGKKVGVAEASSEDVRASLEQLVTLTASQDSLSWASFVQLDIIGCKAKRLKIYEMFNLGYGNAKTLYKRLNMLGITKEEIEKKLEATKESL